VGVLRLCEALENRVHRLELRTAVLWADGTTWLMVSSNHSEG
jgi:hypothetical protein